MASSLRLVVLFVIFASFSVTAFGAGLAYKAVRYARRLADWARRRSEPRADGRALRSAEDELRLPGAREARPAVQVQMVRNWTKAFADGHVAPLVARLARALKRLDRLDREARRQRVATEFERMELNRVRRELYRRGAGLVSVATQTPKPPPPPVLPPPPVPKRRVRFSTLPESWRVTPKENSNPSQSAYVKTKCLSYGQTMLRTIIDCLNNPIMSPALAIIIAGWSTKILNIEIEPDLEDDKTMMEMNMLTIIHRGY